MKKLDKVVIAEKGDLSDNLESGLQITEDLEGCSPESSSIIDYEIALPSASRLVHHTSTPETQKQTVRPKLVKRKDSPDADIAEVTVSPFEEDPIQCAFCQDLKAATGIKPCSSGSFNSMILLCNDQVELYGWRLFKGCSKKYCTKHGSPSPCIAQASAEEKPKSDLQSSKFACLQVDITGHYCMECETKYLSAKRRRLEIVWLIRVLTALTIFVLIFIILLLKKEMNTPIESHLSYEGSYNSTTLPSSKAQTKAPLAAPTAAPEITKVLQMTPSRGKISLPVSPTEECKLQYHRSADGRACEQEVCNLGFFLSLEGRCIQTRCQEGFSVDHSGKHCIRTCSDGHFFDEEADHCLELKCPKYSYASEDGEECLRLSCSFGMFTSASGTFCQECKDIYFADLEPEQVEECQRKPNSKHTFLQDYQNYLKKLPSIGYCEGEFISGLPQPTLSKVLSSLEPPCRDELELKYAAYPYDLEPGWRWLFFEELEKLEQLSSDLISSAPKNEDIFVLNGFFRVDDSNRVDSSLHCLNQVNLRNTALAISSCFPILA